MGDTISQAEKDAIAAFKGPVTKCPEGSAAFASLVLHAAGGFHGWLAEAGILIEPVEWSWKLSDRQTVLGMDRQSGKRPSEEIRNDEIQRMAKQGTSHDDIAFHFQIHKRTVANILWQMRRAA